MKSRDYELTFHTAGIDPKVLRIHRMLAKEQLGQLFEVELEMVMLEGQLLEPDEIIGASCHVDIEIAEETARTIHGLVTHVVELPPLETEMSVYRLTVHPLLWQSTLVETLDIHLGCSVPEVLEAKLALLHLAVGTDYSLQLSETYPQRELITQYQESDLALLSRLCEHVGIFFYFAHEKDSSLLVFGDDTSAYRPIDGDDAVPYRARGESAGVLELTLDRSLIPGIFVCRDYNYRTPTLELQLKQEVDEGFGGAVIEYGGHFNTPDGGQHLAKVRAEEALSRLQVFSGTSDDPRFAPGHTFQLEGHPKHSGTLVLTSVEHDAAQPVAGFGAGDEHGYRNRFTAIPADRTYRPPRATPVPRIHGMVTGVIESSQGDLQRFSKLDSHGRYMVKFLFDTAAPGERQASCPVRLMQPSAGTGYGTHFPLKPGVEVAVGFVGGNPDRPIILGAVPNPITPTPVYDAGSTKSRIKTRSGIVIEFDDADRG